MRTRLTALALVAVACGCRNGEVSVLGYSSAPPFDPSVRSVYVPVFKTSAFVATPNRGIEFRLTEAIVQEINGRRTPMRVVSDPARADTELVGTIVRVLKLPYSRTFQNHNREFETLVTAEVVWRDLRTGKVLSGSRGGTAPDRPPPFDPTVPVPADPPPAPLPVPTTVQATGRTLPELGETNATGEDMAIKALARQIVNMMEAPW
jgi:hypothetical protein